MKNRNVYALAAIAAACALGTGPVLAQKVQKYRTPDGKIVYSDTPVPGARLVDEIAPPPPPDPKAVEAARAAAQKRSEQADRAAGQRLERRAGAQSEAEAAATALEQAKRRLEAGREPLPGERLGTVSGKSRLTDEYFARQRANEAAVAEAQARLDKARSGAR
ncbi:MAG: DUF4124 domain-containing protein [Burkholderiales bacterium]|nr:DUF4124 domain-containing protein [Burkholderiales bacterium]